jgi:hypothetical protein
MKTTESTKPIRHNTDCVPISFMQSTTYILNSSSPTNYVSTVKPRNPLMNKLQEQLVQGVKHREQGGLQK